MQRQRITQTIGIGEAKALFREQGAVGNRTQQSVETYMNGVRVLEQWCAENDYSDTEDLTVLTLGGFNPWLAEREQWSEPYKESITCGARQFVKFLEERRLVEDGTHTLIKYHTVPKSERQSANSVAIERLDHVVDYLEYYHRHRKDTVAVKLLSETGMRTCALHSIDVGDVRLDAHSRPEIAVRSRSNEGTKLKEGDDHERNVPITKELFNDLKGYVKHRRIDAEDEYGRTPLLTTRNGRFSKGGIQDVCYKWTCPPYTGESCTCCEGKPPTDEVYGCEMSHGPHAIRGAAITRFRNGGHTWEDISEMVAATPTVLRLQYDYGDFEERADRARSLLDSL